MSRTTGGTSTSPLPPEADAKYETGSFRDRGSRVFYAEGQVFRAMSAEAMRAWLAVSSLRFFAEAHQDGRIVRTELAESTPPADDLVEWAGVLHHEAVPFVSYPYEWCFGMLREAALLQLELLESGLEEGVILKDATPFNIQFCGARPVFIDVASLVPHHEGEAWIGYRQFCQMFLYPLMLQAYRGFSFQPLLRGAIGGIPPREFARLLSARDWLRRGVLTHGVLHAALEGRLHREDRSVAQDIRRSGFSRSMIVANLRKLRRIVERLQWREKRSAWSEYDAESEPVQRDAAAKEDFVRQVIDDAGCRLVWDLGCNRGRYSRLAADRGAFVVAMDGDHWTVEQLFRALHREGHRRILPLVMNLADASPGLGWRGRERRTLEDRGRPDLILALALIHHLVIRENLLLSDVLDWLSRSGERMIIEFVDREDPQVQSLLRNRPDACDDYCRENFDRRLEQRFRIVRRRTLPSGTRTLFDVIPL